MARRKRLGTAVKSALLPKKSGSFRAKGALATGRAKAPHQVVVKAASPRRERFRFKPAKHI